MALNEGIVRHSVGAAGGRRAAWLSQRSRACGWRGSGRRTVDDPAADAARDHGRADRRQRGRRRAAPSRHAHRQVADPEEANSFPAPASVRHKAAADADEGQRRGRRRRRALRRRSQGASWRRCRPSNAAPSRPSSSALTPVPGGHSIGGDGTIPIPAERPRSRPAGDRRRQRDRRLPLRVRRRPWLLRRQRLRLLGLGQLRARRRRPARARRRPPANWRTGARRGRAATSP